MSQWHRENPELAGTWADPWMQHESYRVALGTHRTDPDPLEPARDVDEEREAE